MSKIISVTPREKYFAVKIKLDACTNLSPTGIVEAKVWNSEIELVKKLKVNSIIKAVLETTKFGEIIKEITVVKEGRVGLTVAEQETLFNRLADRGLSSHLINLLEDYKHAFCSSPAARKHHHDYVGGLLQHTSEVLDELSKTIYSNPQTLTLLTDASVLHDFGKIFEYNIDTETGIVTYNENFQKELGLEGSKVSSHIMWAYNWAMERGLIQLARTVGAHHGCLEWGSLLIPQTPEAHMLFMADYKSSKLGKITVDLLGE